MYACMDMVQWAKECHENVQVPLRVIMTCHVSLDSVYYPDDKFKIYQNGGYLSVNGVDKNVSWKLS